jgi:hypothetical protein
MNYELGIGKWGSGEIELKPHKPPKGRVDS